MTGVGALRSGPTFGPAVGAALAREFHADSVSTMSSFGSGGIIAVNGSWIVGAAARLHLDHDRWRVASGVEGYSVNYDFFGIGNAAGDADQSVDLTQAGAAFLTEGLYRVVNRLYVGPRYRYITVGSSVNNGKGSPSLIALVDSQENRHTSALGGAAEYDSRNDVDVPTHGYLGRLVGMWARPGIGSDSAYQYGTAWVNGYTPFFSRTRVLAGRVAGCTVSVRAPLNDLCQFGLGPDLRGYVGGRYRDQTLLAGQVEWRAAVARRWGVVVFAGVGEVAPAFDEFAWDNMLGSAGAGVRYLWKDSSRVPVGIDVAFGKNQGTFYFRLGEAF